MTNEQCASQGEAARGGVWREGDMVRTGFKNQGKRRKVAGAGGVSRGRRRGEVEDSGRSGQSHSTAKRDPRAAGKVEGRGGGGGGGGH